MEFIISFLSEWGYLALFICMALENMNIPIPSEIILGFAGFLVSQGVFSFWPTILIGTLAGLIGSLASYYMGYKGGRDMILRHTQKGGMGAKKMIAAKNWFETYGGIAGIAQFPLPEFTILTIIGTIPWTIFLVYMGAMLGENWHSLLSYKLEIALVCIVICAIIAAAFHFYQKHKNNKHEAQ